MFHQPAHAPRRDDAGFTLVELLIVMSVILILITLAIPGFERVHIKADQTSAIASVRMLNSMEAEYNSNYPSHGYACSLATLGGKAGSGTPTPAAPPQRPAHHAPRAQAGDHIGVDQYNSYQITATPVAVGRSGNNGYCSDETGQIRFDPKGGSNCTEILQ